MKELQFSVNNLLHIDEKNITSHYESEQENQYFIKKLSEQHPELNKQELNFCIYFRINLNSKEIASICNITYGTVRVYKTRIKTKMGLNASENLNEYLFSL